MMRDPKQSEGSPRAEVLRLIQKQGSASIKDLEAAMGVTTTAVREQVAHLLQRGLLQATRVRGEIGRPYYVYSLTAKAQDLFPKDYATLAMLLLEETLPMRGPRACAPSSTASAAAWPKVLGADPGQGAFPEIAWRSSAALGESGMEVSMLPMAENGRRLCTQDGHPALIST